MTTSLRRNSPLLLLLALSLFALAPLFSTEYFYDAHDGRHGVFYLLQFDASIQDGALWPRWAMHHNQGYGYPTFLIQAPLAFYVAEIFVLLGLGYTAAVKATWISNFLMSALGMYALIVHWLSSAGNEQRARVAGLIAGLAYLYIPYRLVDIYVRAALSDTFLLAWFPWVILAFDRLIARGSTNGWQRRLAIASLLLAATLLTHSFALLSFAPFVITFVLFRLWLTHRELYRAESSSNASTKQVLLPRTFLAAAGGIGALLLSAIFVLPLLAEGPLLQADVYTTRTYDFRSHFVYFGQFFSPFWGFGFSDDPSGGNDGMSFQIGALAWILSVALLTIWRTERGQALSTFLLMMSSLILLVMMPIARPLWERITPLAVIQFPWRLLSLSAFTFSALAGVSAFMLATTLPNLDNRTARQIPAGMMLLGLLVVFASIGYIDANLASVEGWREDGRAIFRFEQEHPDMYGYTQFVREEFAQSPMTEQYAADDYIEEYGEDGIFARLAILGEGEVKSQYSRGSSAGGVVDLVEASAVVIHIYYFPGWQVRVDGEVVEHRVSDPHGLIELDVPAGVHRIDARFGSTPARRIGAVLSALAALAIVGLLVWETAERVKG